MAPISELVARYVGPPAHLLDNQKQGMGCVPYDPLVLPPYNYVPHVAPGAIFVACFGLAFIGHIFQAAISRKWWYTSLILGAMCELMGWCARLYSHWCPYNNNAFVLQISILIIAPCFFSAALYYIEAELIRKYGTEHTLIPPKLYLWIFIGADIVSIAVQGAGGGLASAASSATPPTDPAPGTHTMIAGIIVQLVSMSLFSLLLFWTMWSTRGYWLTGPNQMKDARKIKIILATTIASDCLILARNYYRAVELGQGWDGFLISTEAYFCVLDAGLMVLAVIIFNVFHPAWYLRGSVKPVAMGATESDKPFSESDEEVANEKTQESSRFQTRL